SSSRISSVVMLSAAIAAAIFFTAPPLTVIYTLSLHDALPISPQNSERLLGRERVAQVPEVDAAHQLLRTHVAQQLPQRLALRFGDRKSTRLNSSHGSISYAVFC